MPRVDLWRDWWEYATLRSPGILKPLCLAFGTLLCSLTERLPMCRRTTAESRYDKAPRDTEVASNSRTQRAMRNHVDCKRTGSIALAVALLMGSIFGGARAQDKPSIEIVPQ